MTSALFFNRKGFAGHWLVTFIGVIVGDVENTSLVVRCEPNKYE